MTPLDRARAYVDQCPPAISGSGGHNQTFAVACALVWGFALNEDEAMAVLREYNQRCDPQWKEWELQHKFDEAHKVTSHEKPCGHLLQGQTFKFSAGPAVPGPRLASSSASPAPSKPAPPKSSLDARKVKLLPLPAPLDSPTERLLMAAFNDGECVGIAQETLSDDGRGVPKDSGAALTRAHWLDVLKGVSGDPNSIFSSSDRTGAFIRINPLKPGGSTDGDVTAWRHVLIEFDDEKRSKPEQYSIIKQSNVPCTAVLDSGRRSIHAWVRVDAANAEEWKERRDFIFDHFKDFGPDPKNKNPSRFSRLPGMVRGDSVQTLLELKCGAESWQDWVQTEGEGLPRIEDAIDLIEAIDAGTLIEPPRLIADILHQGHKLVLGGGSKTNKSWCLIDLALSVASGASWLGHQCLSGAVLYLNFEIDRFHFGKRLQWVAEKKGIKFPRGNFHAWNLRGHAMPGLEMTAAIKRFTKGREYRLIMLDPFYKMIGTADENKATDVAMILNAIESVAEHTGAATAFAAHFSKGNQAQKESIDRISGSGVFARDPDAIMMLTPHEEDGAFVVDTTLRNFPTKLPYVVKWDFPLLTKVNDLDPKKLRRIDSKPIYTIEQLTAILTEPLRNCDLFEKMNEAHGISQNTFNNLLKKAVKAGKICRIDDADKVTRYKVKNEPF